MRTKPELDILLIEDDPNDVELALIAFRKTELIDRIHVLRDGEEAVNFIFAEGANGEQTSPPRPRLILLDLKLPKLTGIEVLRTLKGNSSTRPIPVIAMTSSKQQQDMIECYDLGVNSYIQKPMDFENFQRTIKDLAYYWLTVNQSLPPEAFAMRRPAPAATGMLQAADE